MPKQHITVTILVETPDDKDAPDGNTLATAIAELLEPAAMESEPFVFSDVTVFTNPPVVVIDRTGGVMQSITSETPIEIVAIDYDDVNPDDEEAHYVPQSDGGKEMAYVCVFGADEDPWRVAAIIDGMEPVKSTSVE